METLLKNFEKYISYILMIVAMLFVCFQVCDLVYHFAAKIAANIQDQTFTEEQPGRPTAGVFFGILLSLEIIQTIRIFAKDHAVKVRVILIVGLIAVTRKILMMEIKQPDHIEEFAIAALIIALSAGYFLVSRTAGSASDD